MDEPGAKPSQRPHGRRLIASQALSLQSGDVSDFRGVSPACRERRAGQGATAGMRSRRLKGFLVPHSDEHQDEFLSPSAERLAWLTGFTGSAGVAIVLDKAAALFVDGRYILQARAQIDAEPVRGAADARRQGVELGSRKSSARARRSAMTRPCTHQGDRTPDRSARQERHQARRRRCQSDRRHLAGPAKAVDRADLPHGLEYSGRERQATRSVTCRPSSRTKTSMPCCSPCWIRSPGCSTSAAATSDTRRVALAYAIVPPRDGPPCSSTPPRSATMCSGELRELRRYRRARGVDGEARSARPGEARRCGSIPTPRRCDLPSCWRPKAPSSLPAPDPCILPKAIKNAVEIKGARAAQLRDGVAMARFLAWLDETGDSGGSTR